jgi:hypothetical protein
LGRWESTRVDQMIYHKNLSAWPTCLRKPQGGRRPTWWSTSWRTIGQRADRAKVHQVGNGWVQDGEPRPVSGAHVLLQRQRHLAWGPCRPNFASAFAGEGEWKITLDVFRDLGLAFGAAMIAIYILLVAQMGSFAVPIVVMLAIPLTVLGVMPGFWLLNVVSGSTWAATSIRCTSPPRA